MRFSPWPEVGSYRRVVVLCLLVAATTWVVLAVRYGQITVKVGDTDDAMRLVLVRELLSGKGWYDQLVTRLQPPQGAWMHWSRLVDGGLAGFDWLLQRLLSPDRAEWAMRFFWPLLWILPATGAALTAARILGPKGAAPLTAILLAVDQQPFIQFVPGRIDHHNIQITLLLVAFACSLGRQRTALFAVLAAVATALDLAVGLEGLVFQALIGAAFALRFAFDPRDTRPAMAYGLSLAVGTLALYGLQTPPGRWLLPQCDSIGANLVLGLVAAGLGLALAARLTAGRSRVVRLSAVALAGAAAAAIYVGLEPICLKGPFALVDPKVGSFWLDHIQELRDLPAELKADPPAGIHFLVLALMSLAAAAYLIRDAWPRPSWRLLLLVALLLATLGIGYSALRMQTYAFWFGLIVIALAVARLFERRFGGAMAPAVILTVVFSPIFLAGASAKAVSFVAPEKAQPQGPRNRCFDIASYARLRTLPPGLLLAGIDEGPHILANTPHAVIAASYHRMWASNLAAHQAFDAPPARAEAAVRALHADYVVDCNRIDQHLDQGSFGVLLRTRPPPPWLERLSPPGEAIQIYKVLPAGAPAVPSAPASPRGG